MMPMFRIEPLCGREGSPQPKTAGNRSLQQKTEGLKHGGGT